jgi:hypothetical protein
MMLHENYLRRTPILGPHVLRLLEGHVIALWSEAAKADSRDPDVSIVIRSRNNVSDLSALIDDLEGQLYSGEVEIIVVDSESRDGSAEHARLRGATVVRISQSDYSHPYALNAGFRVAQHSWVFSLVEHSSLSHIHSLRTAKGSPRV